MIASMDAARRLALGRLISLMGGSAAYIALIAALYEHTGSAAWVSAALFAGVVGSVIGAPGAGWVGDRFERRRVMIATDLASAAVAGAMALVIDEPAALVGLFGLLAIVESPFAPASAAAIPNLVGREAAARANSLVAATSAAGYLLGPLAGGLLLGVGVSAPHAVRGRRRRASSSRPSFVALASGGSFGRGGGTESHPGVLAGVRLIARERDAAPARRGLDGLAARNGDRQRRGLPALDAPRRRHRGLRSDGGAARRRRSRRGGARRSRPDDGSCADRSSPSRSPRRALGSRSLPVRRSCSSHWPGWRLPEQAVGSARSRTRRSSRPGPRMRCAAASSRRRRPRHTSPSARRCSPAACSSGRVARASRVGAAAACAGAAALIASRMRATA